MRKKWFYCVSYKIINEKRSVWRYYDNKQFKIKFKKKFEEKLRKIIFEHELL